MSSRNEQRSRRWITRAGLIRLSLLAALGYGVIHWTTSMPGSTFSGTLPALSEDDKETAAHLKTHVVSLCEKVGPRSVSAPKGLQAARNYLQTQLSTLGYQVEAQEFDVAGVTCANLEVEVAGTSTPSEIVVVGGHYDSYRLQPGANDNATGTAAVLELARLLHGSRLARTLRFVAFVNEEPPYFETRHMGSRIYAQRCRERGEDVVAMLSLETMGYYSDEDGSQRYPPAVGWLYPSRGDFIGFVGNVSSRSLVRRAVGTFRRSVRFPSEGAALPAFLAGVGWSDHASFWKEGYSAVMVTDTALFRYPYYHTLEDTADKIDFERLARVVTGLADVVRDLAGPAQ